MEADARLLKDVAFNALDGQPFKTLGHLGPQFVNALIAVRINGGDIIDDGVKGRIEIGDGVFALMKQLQVVTNTGLQQPSGVTPQLGLVDERFDDFRQRPAGQRFDHMQVAIRAQDPQYLGNRVALNVGGDVMKGKT